jgi:hypothetical protein
VAVSLECGNEILGSVDENKFPSLGIDNMYSKIIAPLLRSYIFLSETELHSANLSTELMNEWFYTVHDTGNPVTNGCKNLVACDWEHSMGVPHDGKWDVHIRVVNNEVDVIEVVCFAVMSHKAY